MNIQRFHAPTSREALAKARMAFGDGTLILSNRQTATGVEVVATAEDALESLPVNAKAASMPAAPASAATAPIKRSTPAASSKKNSVEADTEKLAMSTLSFQDYVRERMLRKRQEALAPASVAPIEVRESSPSVQPIRVQRTAPESHMPKFDRPAPSFNDGAHSAAATKGIVDELHSMKEMIEERFNTLAWLGQARQDPIQSNLMLKLIRAGFSPTMARTVLERMPEQLNAADSVRWVMDVLEHNLKTAAPGNAPHEVGGIYALIGATGVGKTTTAAKLAALCVKEHGASSVGLITLDTYRIAAHEQLRSYGRMLGVVAHLAHDRAALQDLLGLLGNKKMVLIDTTGLAPRDPRTRDMLDVLDLPKINRLLTLNAGSHGDTLDETMTSFKTGGIEGVILSKVDEAAKLGPALDSIIRHQLTLCGITQGQRVPEDWEAADAAKLIKLSMRAPIKSAFDPKATDLGFFFHQSAQRAPIRGALNA